MPAHRAIRRDGCVDRSRNGRRTISCSHALHRPAVSRRRGPAMSGIGLQGAPIWMLAAVVIALGLATTGFMAAQAVADGRADSVLGAMLSPADSVRAADRGPAPGSRGATRIAGSEPPTPSASAARW
ncbi:MAG: hypothetical protein K9L70_11410 [Thiohalocapsa sp.]|nr:hypothetical protein [Thiohalocapsa sp.]